MYHPVPFSRHYRDIVIYQFILFYEKFVYRRFRLFFQRLLHLRRMVHGARNEVQLLQHKTLDVVYVTFS